MSKKSHKLRTKPVHAEFRSFTLHSRGAAVEACPTLTLKPVAAAVLAVLGAGLSAQVCAGPISNTITLDGRTKTQITVNGGVTSITTQTVSGADAFNSFAQFQVAAQNQVNLYLPTNTENLINLVTGGQTEINGILNSYKNGQIGGRVFFADPYGLVVGAQGVINVGALSVSAPTQQFMSRLMGADGSVDSSALSALLSGTEPLSSDGEVSILGQVHALDAVRLRAEEVDTSGLIWVMGGDGTDALAGDAVNTQDASQGTALVNHGGSIEIVSVGDTNIDGTLQADGATNQSGGSITILAGQNANIGGSGRLSAKGQGSNADGGQITVKAGNDTSVGSGAHFIASAGSSGDGGSIEVSAANNVSVGSVAFDASATNGHTGSVLFDPVDQSSINGTITTSGADFDDEDATSIEVTSTGKVDTTNTTGAAGSITLGAPSISIDTGGQLIANDGTHTPGDITLTAEQDQSVGSGLGSASTSVTVNGTLNGGDIDIDADASGTASYSSVADSMETVQETLASMPSDWASKLSLATDSFLAGLLPVGVDIGAASASIDIQGSANIQAAGNLTIASSTDTKASMPALDSVNGTPLMAAAVYGEVYGNATTTVDSGAALSVAGSNTLTVQATNKDELEVSATVNSDADSVDITAAVGYANVTSNATIAAGANVNAANVVVLAHNSNSFGVDSAVTAAKGGEAGIAAAVSVTNTSATAQENANLGSTAAPINSLVVDASSSAEQNKTGADTKVGSAASGTTPTDVVSSGGDALPDYLQELLGKELTKADEGTDTTTGSSSNSSEPSTSPFKLGSAISVADSSQNASASIGANAQVAASGQVAVHSSVEDDDVHNSAASEVTSSEKSGNAASLSVSAGISVGLYQHDAAASIGTGAVITSPEIGVGSNIDIPWDLDGLNQWDGLSTLNTAVSDLLEKSGAPIMTSYVDAQSDTGDVGLAGAVSYLSMQNTSTAWVDSGATLQCDAASQCTPNSQANWTTPPVQYGTDETSGDPLTDSFSWTLPFDIAADNSVQTLNDAGNFSLMELNGTGGEDSSTSVGGGFDDVNYINTTIAGVAANAVISVPTESLAVNADSSDTAITVTPTAGRGSGVSANVIMAMANVDNITHASISNAAQVTAGEVDVDAHEGINIWTIAGAISQGSSAGVGVGVGVNNLKTNTQAYVGDNTCDAPGAAASCTPANTSGGQIKADTLNVQALTDGQSGAIAVSGSAATGSDDSGDSGEGSSGGSGSGGSGGSGGSSGGSGASLSGALGFINTISTFLSNFPALKSVSDQVTQTTSSLTTLNTIVGKATATESKESGKDAGSDGSGGEQQEGPKFGIAISGSATVNISNLATTGFVDGVTVTPDQDASNNVTVNGLNNTFLISASGAGALASAKNSSSKFSAGIAGAVAFSLIQNSTDAYIDDATLTDVDGLAVQALSGGSEVDLGLGLAVNTSSSSNSVSVSGSFSLSGVQNNTSANLSGDTVTGSGSTTSAANVIAYNNTTIGAGGGSLSVGGKGAVGIAVTLSDIGNLPGTTPTTPYGEEAAIDGGTLGGFDNLNVEGLDSSRIVDGAVAVAATSKTLALTGEFVFNNIGEVTAGSIGGGAGISNIAGTVTVAGAGVDPNGTTPDGSSVAAFNTLLTGDGSPVDASLIDFSGVSLLGGSGAPLGSAIYGVVGGVSVGKNAAGLAFVLNNIENSNSATVSNATLSTASSGAVNLDATNNTYILGLAVGVGVSTGNFAGVGSVTANLINDSATATLGDTGTTPAATTVTAGSLGINATNGANINSLAGNVAISTGSTAAGVAIAFNQIGDQTGATLDNATTNTSGATTVAGISNGSIESAAVAGAVGDDVALSGSFSINDIGTDDLGSSSIPQTYTNATLENSTVTAATLNDQASDSATIKTLSGSITASGDAAIGAAFTLDNISDNTNAEADNSNLIVSGSTGVNAKSTAEIDGIAVGGAGSGDLAIVGSFTLNAIANGLDAGMNGVTMNAAGDQTGKVQVTATDQSQIESLAGAVAISGGAGVGIALAYNSIGDTAAAHVDGGNYSVTDMTVQALSQDPTSGSANIQTIAAGVGGGAEIGGAASVAVNLLTGGTSAYIDNGANVTAADNVGVIANTQQGVDVLAGSVGIGVSAAAVGVGAVVNYLDNGTNAYISGSSTQVTANAKDNTDTLTVGTGTLANPPDVDSVNSMSDYVTPDLSETTQQVQGVVVNASTEQYAATLGISAALSFDIGSVSLAVMGNANVIGGTTQAYVDSADVTSSQQLNVNASNHSYNANFDLGVAASGGFSGAAAVSANSFKHSTDAYISNATTTAQAVNVDAQATQDAVGLTAGLAGGIVSAAGTGIINIFDDDTSAYVDQGSLTSGSLNVNANSEDNANLFGGAGAIGGAAVAGTFVLAVSENDTSAYVGDDKNDTNLSLTGALDVEADSTTNTSSLTVSGSAAGGVGVAGMAVVNVVQNQTNAYLDQAQLNQEPSQSGSGAVTVKANENITLKPYTGAVAGGGAAGVGAAANLAILQSQVGATITDSKLNSADAVQVEALSSKDIEPITVTAGVGGTAGISGGASLILFGSGSTGSGNTDVMSQLSGTLGEVSSFGSQNNISDPGNTLNSSQSSQLQQDTGFSLLGSGGALPGNIDGTSALISSSTVTASSVSVKATDTTYTKSITGALAAGGVGAGAAIGYTGLYDQVTALVDSSSVLTTPSLTVSATEQDGSGNAAEVDAFEGAGGLVGLGVSAAVANVNNTVTAGAGGALNGDSSSGSVVNVTAADSSSVSTTGAGASVGIAAAGLVITQSNKSSSVTAELGDASGDTANVSGFDSVSLNASDQGAVSASSTGGAGGLGIAADGADANATDSAAVTAQVGKNTQITTPTNGSVSIQASDTPDTSANVIGVAVAGGVGLAVSVATAQVMHTVTSTVLGGASITGPGSLSISASSSPDGGNDPTAYANSIAGGGGVLAGADGSVAIATSGGYDSGFNPVSGQSASIAASTGSGVALPDGDISITATNTTNQSSNATGVAVGFLAVGATVSQAGSNTSTTATLGSGDTGTLPTHTTPGRDGDITVQATGTDNNLAASTAGSGGAIAGNAAVAQTDDTPTVTALIGNNLDLTAGTITLAAQHTDNYAAEGNTVNAAIAGASGADAINNANANVTACIGLAVCTPNGPTTSTQDTDLIASGDISISADNYFNEVNSGDSAQGAGGGVLSGQAVSSSTTLNGGAAVNFGDNTSLDSGTDFVNNPGGINVSVESGLIADDTVTLTTGGAITVAGTNSSLDANLNNNVTLGQSDTFVSDGEIGLGTDTQVRASTNSEGHTWDLGGASVSYATTDVTSNQNIDVGSDDTLMGFGDVNITAGEANGYDTSISGLANAQSYITGLIVIPYASANTTLLSQANVNVASGANILSAGDITLGAYEGQPQGSADGTGHGYELGFIPATSHNSNVTTQNCGSQGCGTLTIDGTVIAGIYHELNININAAGQLQAPTTPEAPFLTANNPNFDAQAYVETLPGYADSSVLQLLASDVATNAPAFAFSTLYAAGGNVTLNADNITGSGGSVTAYGAPTITVNNYSPDYLVFGSLDVPSTPSGQVLFTGLADQSQATANGVSIATPGAGQLASITINDIWTGRSGNGSEGPAIFLSCSNLFGPCAQSDLENNGTNNLLGSVSITDENGSYGQFNNGIAAQSIVIDVPNGLVGITNPNGLVVTGESPLSAWQDEMLNMSDPNVAVAYVANWLFQGSRGSDQQLTAATVNQGCNAGMVLGCSTVVGDGNGNYGTSGGVSWDFYGSCIPAGPWDCSGGTADSDSPIGQSLGSDYYGHSSDFQYPMIPVEPLSTTTLNYPTDFPVGQTNSQLTGAEVAIQAKYIDVDSNITAGNATSWSTQISSAINTWITDPASNPDSLAAEQAAGDCSNGICPIPSTYLTNSLLSTLSPGDSQVTAGYDTSNNQIVLNNINASGGGFVYFNGGIISTNQSGSININDGYGHVTVDNQSGYSLVVNNVNTGNGAVGEVQIVDTLKPKNNGTPDTTWYVYSQGSGLSVYNNTQGETTLAQAVTDNDLLSGASSSYQPLQDAQLVWTETANMYRGVDWSTHTSTKWSFDYPNPHDPSNPWSVSSFNVTTDPSGEPPAFQETVTGASASDDGNWGYDFFHGCNSSGTDCHWSYPEVWETDFITSASITVQDAVKADNPIAISFQGNSSGAINISSNNSVTVGGQLYNPSGSTSISASNATAADGYIAQGSSGSVLSNNLTLNATGGIGGTPVTGTNGLVDSFQSPFKAQLIAGSAVNAAAGAEGIQLSFNSSALIGLVSSGNAVSGYGNVSISAEGDLNAGGSYSLLPVNQQSGSYLSGTLVIAGPGTIIGDDINLVSSTGGVGGDGTPLTLVNGYSLLPQSGGTQGTVNVSALNDINLVGVGDMLVDQIDSATGNVSVYVPNGRILDANALTASQTLSQEQLETIWDNLKLAPFTDPSTGISVSQTDINNAVTANTIAPFEYLVQSNYQNYWRLLDNGSVVNGQFQPSATGSTLFGPLAQANNETVQQYTSNQYQQIVTFFNNNLGSEWQDQSQFQSYVANWTYTATQAQVTALTSNSSYMNTGQLTQAINSTALLPSSGTLVGNAIPNISGRQVALVSGSGVGALGTPVTINVACSATVTDCLMNGTLNPTEAAALATAITPGDVTPVVQGTTITGLAVIQTEPLFVNPTGPLSVNGGQGAVYLQANQNLEVANVTAYGDVWLAANGDITNVAPSGQSAITTYDGGNLTLISGNGNLGTPAAGSASTVPLTLNLSGSLLAASAGQGIILEQLNGNLVVGHVYAVGDENISAPMGSILADPDVQGLNFLAQNITLTAQNNLGSVSQPLEIQDGGSTTGLFNGSSGGIVDVYSPANTSPANTNFAIGELSAGSDLNVTTGLGVNLSAITLTSGGVLTAASGNDANFGQVSSQQQLSLDSFGDMTLDSAVSQTGNISATSGGLFAVTTLAATNGSIIASSVGDMDLAAKGQFDTSNSQTLTAGSFTMNAGSQLQAGGPIAITTTINSITVTDSVTNQSSLVSSSGDITLGSVDSTLANGMALSLNATGAILGNDDGQTNLTAVAGAQTQLQAGTGIGQPQLPLVTMLPWLQANTLSGGIYIHDLETLNAPNGLNAGGDINLSVVGDLTFGNASAGGNAMLDATGKVSGATLESGTGNTVVTGGADITLTNLNSGESADVTSAGKLSITSATAGQDIALNSVNGIGFQQLTAGSNINGVTTQGDILGGSLDAGGAVNLSGVNIQLDDAKSGISLALAAQQALNAGVLTSGGAINLQAGSSVNLDSVSAGQGITFLSAGDFAFQQLTADGDINGQSSNGNILGGSLNANGDINLSGVNLILGHLTAGGSASLKAVELLNLPYASIGGNLSLTSAGSLDFEKYAVGSTFSAESTQGSITGESLTAVNADLSALKDIQLSSADITHSLNLAAADITANVYQSKDTSPFQMTITGFNGGIADNVALEVDASGGLTLVLLRGKQVQLNTTAEQVQVNQAYVPDWFYLVTPSAKVLVANADPVTSLRPVDVQLYQPNYSFQLIQSGQNTFTDSYVVQYQFPYQVQVPNYDQSHASMGPTYDDESVVRNVFRNLMNNPSPLDTSLFGIQAIVNPDGTVSYPGLAPQTVTASPQGAVNTGTGPVQADQKR